MTESVQLSMKLMTPVTVHLLLLSLHANGPPLSPCTSHHTTRARIYTHRCCLLANFSSPLPQPFPLSLSLAAAAAAGQRLKYRMVLQRSGGHPKATTARRTSNQWWLSNSITVVVLDYLTAYHRVWHVHALFSLNYLHLIRTSPWTIVCYCQLPHSKMSVMLFIVLVHRCTRFLNFSTNSNLSSDLIPLHLTNLSSQETFI